MVVSQLNIRPVFDVHADVEGRDLNSAAAEIEKAIDAARQTAPKGVTITLSGQIETMKESYSGLFSGMALAVVLVFLLLVINFQSWIDPLIVLFGSAVCARRRDMDAVSFADPHQRAGIDGYADVHRADHGQQHSGRHLRQSAHQARGRCAHRGHRGRLHALAPRSDDSGRHDSRAWFPWRSASAREANRMHRWHAR